PFQLDLSVHINTGKDIFCVCVTGAGKTVLLQAGTIVAAARGETGICLIIIPTKVLVEQQAEVASEWGLRALPINKDTIWEAALVKCSLWQELSSGDNVRIVIMTPQMVQGTRMQQLLSLPIFAASVRWVSIDEAHLIDQQDGVFVGPYLGLFLLQVKLPSTAMWMAVTVTAMVEHTPIIAAKLGFKADAYINARYLVNRPNIKYIPHFFEHPTTGTEHLNISFVIPRNLTSAKGIISTVIFVKTIERRFSYMDYLDILLPSESLLPHQTLQRPHTGGKNQGIWTPSALYACGPHVWKPLNKGASWLYCTFVFL
ncbi:hypothetical protein K438DRAFT_1609121, partial [Mycena galopus ATCC 62051]